MADEHSRLLLLAQRATGRPQGLLEQALEASRVTVSLDRHARRFADHTGPPDHAAAWTRRTRPRTRRAVTCGGRSAGSGRRGRGSGPSAELREPRRQRMHHQAPCGNRRRPRRPIVPEGYGAHIVGQATAVIRPSRPGNAIGAIYTAALGAAEAFKRTARVLPGRRVLHRHLWFCPVTLASDLRAAPDLPRDMDLDLALLGVGAVGTGIVLLLDAMNATGRLLAADRERFGPENRGTYSLGGQRKPWPRPGKPTSPGRRCAGSMSSHSADLWSSFPQRSTAAPSPGSALCSRRWTRQMPAGKHSAYGQTGSSTRPLARPCLASTTTSTVPGDA